MATINPAQDYDVIHTLTFASGSGTCNIRLYRGSVSAFTGTVYYRAGTFGAWTELSVSGTSTTFPVSSTTMQIGHSNNKSGDNYMTVSFYGQATNLNGIAISQKAAFSGAVGDYFMFGYAYECSGLSSLAVPDTSGITSVGNYFMAYYAYECSSLLRLDLPAAGWFVGHDIDWGVPSARLGSLKGYVTNATDLAAWKALTTSGKTLYLNYIRYSGDVVLEKSGGGGAIMF